MIIAVLEPPPPLTMTMMTPTRTYRAFTMERAGLGFIVLPADHTYTWHNPYGNHPFWLIVQCVNGSRESFNDLSKGSPRPARSPTPNCGFTGEDYKVILFFLLGTVSYLEMCTLKN